MGFRKAISCLWDNAGKQEVVLFLLAIFLLGVGVTLDVTHQSLYERERGWVIVAFIVCLLAATIPTMVRCAGEGYSRVWLICGTSAVVLTLFVICFFLAYFAFVGTSEPSIAVDKILNLPPVLAAMWAAGMGWYVHFQASSKNNRTTNSFNLLMQTRTSAEFLKMQAAAQRVYPHGVSVPIEDIGYFSALKQSQVLNAAEAAEQAGPITIELADERRKAEAVNAIKYLLNYYEFMAVGLTAKDLDENLLYETIAVNVTSVYERAEHYIAHVRKGANVNQPLAFESIEVLAKIWQGKLKDEVHDKEKQDSA